MDRLLRTRRGRSVSLAATVLALTTVAAADPGAAERFGALPRITHAQLSPDGAHFAAVRTVRGLPYLALGDVDSTAEEAPRFIELKIMSERDERIRGIRWLNDDIVGVEFEFTGNRLGVPTTETRLIGLSRTLDAGTAIPRPAEGTLYNTQLAHRVLDWRPDDPEYVLMALDREGLGRELSVFRVSVTTGRATKLLHGNEFVADYLADTDGVVRLRLDVRNDAEELHVRADDSSRWRRLARAPYPPGLAFRPLAFGEDPRVLLVMRLGTDGLAEVAEYDIAAGRLGRTVAAHPVVDVTGVVTDPYTRRVVGTTHAVDHATVLWSDDGLAAIQRTVDATLPDTDNTITSWDRRRRRVVVYATAPTSPGTYYLYDREAGELRPLGDTYPGLAGESLRPVEPVAYIARDSLPIPGYLTRPAGGPPYPLVVLPHGGPTARDYREFNYLAQFLAGEGYAVLQPNFRGSSGYGAPFRDAGDRQWGLAMQDDLEDGTRAMIERGVADPDRICIVGWSYGGYAALMGVVRSPELYVCAVAGAPVTDIPLMLRDEARYKFATRDQPTVGSYRQDKDTLRDNSPVTNADVIRVPVLLVHGDEDVTVPYRHSRRMAAALARLDKPHRLVTLPGGNHRLAGERNRIRFLEELGAFLARHLAASDEAAPATDPPRDDPGVTPRPAASSAGRAPA